jgi:hypothetical protein
MSLERQPRRGFRDTVGGKIVAGVGRGPLPLLFPLRFDDGDAAPLRYFPYNRWKCATAGTVLVEWSRG